MTVFVFTILMAGASALFISIFRTSTQQSLVIDTADQARKVVFNFTNELRSASSGNEGSYPLNLASTSQIIIFSSYGAVGQNIHRIRYFVATSTLYKGVVVPTGNPLVYNLGSEKVVAVQKGLANGSVPVFYYYDGNYGGTSTPLSQPVNINQVKFVKMNLVLLKQDTKNATTTYPISAGGSIRNLKTNLGN